jgi:hypothetical protein
MKSKIVMAIAGAFLASSLIAAPATTFAGNTKAKCEAKAHKKKVADKDMEAFMKKCMAHKAKKAEKKEAK